MNRVTSIKSAETQPGIRHRNNAIDAGRGLIVALMALDHVRIFFAAAQFDPIDLDSTNLGWFLTRWVTHLCAPGFFFIAGLGAALMEQRAPKAEVSRFLLARGAWLIALEILVFGFAWSFNPGWFWFGVIWGLGASMILLAGLIHLPRLALLAAAGSFTLLHADLAPLVIGGGRPGPLLALLYTGGLAEIGPLAPRLVLYSVLPWSALMVLGYASTPWLIGDGAVRAKRAVAVGAGAIFLFLLLRLTGIGELRTGFDQVGSADRVFMSFLNVEKYPPTLQFSLITLGIGLITLAAFSWAGNRPNVAVRPLLAFGRVPFFFYFLHLFLIHGLALMVALLAGWPTGYSFWSGVGPNLVPPVGYGVGLVGVYAVWLAVLGLMYPLCLWFGGIKLRHRTWWIRYL